MNNKFVLVARHNHEIYPPVEYLTYNFTTWTGYIERAHRFVQGAALNVCVEEFRRTGAYLIEAPESGLIGNADIAAAADIRGYDVATGCTVTGPVGGASSLDLEDVSNEELFAELRRRKAL